MLRSLIALSLVATSASRHRAEPPHQHEVSGRTEPDFDKPLEWMVAAQNDDGSWGDESRDKRPDVAQTSIAGIALLRLGKHPASMRRAVAFVSGAVERTPERELAVQTAGTLAQRKLGRNIDTYLAAQFLAEALPKLSGPIHARAEKALAAAVRKIELAQAGDGSYSKDGWAPLLASAFANNGLIAARGAGVKVSEKTLDRGQQNLVGKIAGRLDTSDSAGVPLYSYAAGAVAAAQLQAKEARTDDERKAKARAEEAGKTAARELASDRVMRGYGTYGGEEHVSYMLTAEAKATIGGDDFAVFMRGMRTRLAQIQRADGTWRGDHCITSTTFCTAASLITLAVQARAASRAS